MGRFNLTPSAAEIDSACLSMNHSFGLMDIELKNRMRFEAKEWLHAWGKEIQDAVPDDIEIYRAIKKSGVRKHGEIARAIAKIYTSAREGSK